MSSADEAKTSSTPPLKKSGMQEKEAGCVRAVVVGRVDALLTAVPPMLRPVFAPLRIATLPLLWQ